MRREDGLAKTAGSVVLGVEKKAKQARLGVILWVVRGVGAVREKRLDGCLGGNDAIGCVVGTRYVCGF